MAAGGAFPGWKGAVFSMAFAVTAGGAVWGTLLFSKKKHRKERIVFGPFLCLGLFLSLLFGDLVWAYLQ